MDSLPTLIDLKIKTWIGQQFTAKIYKMVHREVIIQQISRILNT